MLRCFAIVALSAVLIGPAAAQDEGRWSGFYIGALGGGGEGRLSLSGRDLPGAVAGGHVGYNWQGPKVVLGVEADLSWSDYDLTLSTKFGGVTTAASASNDFFTSLRGRIGFAEGPVLLYGTAGIGYTEVDTSLSFVGAGVSIRQNDTTDVAGAIGGIGIEYAVTSNVSLRAESLWFKYWQDFDTTEGSYDGYFVRGGLTYSFR